MTIDGSEFRRVLGHFATGVTVVTADTPDSPVGMAIGSFSSVSLDPPLVMFCPGKESATWKSIRESGSFCVNVLGHHQKDVCGKFASKDPDKFAGVEWTAGTTGSPILADAIAWIDCTVHAVHDGGDHDIVVGLVKALDGDAHHGPLLFFKGGYGRYEDL